MIVKIEGEGLNFSSEVNMHQAGQIISFLSLAKPIIDQDSPSENKIVTMNILPQQTITPTPAEEIISSGASSYAEKITAIGNFLTKRDHREHFLIEDVKTILKKLGQFPSTFSRELKNAIDLRYIYEENDKLGYVVTETGKNAIAEKFPVKSVNNKNAKKKAVTNKKPSAPLSIQEKVENMTFTTDLEGFGGFYSYKTKREKILWILKFAEVNGIESLNSKEIEFISTKLKDQILQKNISAFNEPNIKNSFIVLNGSNFRIQKKGEDYLKNINQGANHANK